MTAEISPADRSAASRSLALPSSHSPAHSSRGGRYLYDLRMNSIFLPLPSTSFSSTFKYDAASLATCSWPTPSSSRDDIIYAWPLESAEGGALKCRVTAPSSCSFSIPDPDSHSQRFPFSLSSQRSVGRSLIRREIRSERRWRRRSKSALRRSGLPLRNGIDPEKTGYLELGLVQHEIIEGKDRLLELRIHFSPKQTSQLFKFFFCTRILLPKCSGRLALRRNHRHLAQEERREEGRSERETDISHSPLHSSPPRNQGRPPCLRSEEGQGRAERERGQFRCVANYTTTTFKESR